MCGRHMSMAMCTDSGTMFRPWTPPNWAKKVLYRKLYRGRAIMLALHAPQAEWALLRKKRLLHLLS